MSKSEEEILSALTSMRDAVEKLNRSLTDSLGKLEEAMVQVDTLGKNQIKLATAILDSLKIPKDKRLSSVTVPLPIRTFPSAERAESKARGLLRPVIRSLVKPCGEIAEAISKSKDEILRTTRKFAVYEMEVLARELSKGPEKVLTAEEREVYRRKVKDWARRLKVALVNP